MSIINKTIESNDSASLNTFTITISTTCWQIFFQMMFDSEMRFEDVIQKDFKIDVFAARDRVVQLSKMRRICETRWKQALNKTKKNYNKKKAQIEFKINDKIFLNAKNIISIRSFKKLNYKYYDFYTINELINKISYKLNFSSIMKEIHDVFHVFLLKLANEKNDETSLFIWIENEKQWKIEEIVDKKVKKNKTSYLIKWLEYSHSNNEWMKKKDMSNVKKTIKKFLKSSTKNDKCVNRRRRWDEKHLMHFFKLFFTKFFFITDFNETSRKQEKKFQFLNLFRKLFTSSRQNEKTSFWRKRKLASEAVCLQRFAQRKHHSFSSSFLFFLFSFFRFSSSSSSSFFLSSRESSSSARSSNEYDSRRRRASFFWRKSENRSWCRSENVWKNESRHHKHFHRCLVSSIAQKRRFIKLIFVDKRSNWHLRLIAQYSRKSQWSWRDEKTVFESRKYFRSFRVVFFFVASWIFSKKELFEFTFRDEHHSRRNQSRWASEWKSCSSQHKKSNQSEIDQSWKSDRQIYNKRTTRQATFKVAQRLQIDRSTSKTHLKTDFIVKNLKQRWQHLRFFFLSRTIFSVFEREWSSLIMLKERKDFHTNDMMKSFKSFFWRLFEKRK